jgi:hypothetical protein
MNCAFSTRGQTSILVFFQTADNVGAEGTISEGTISDNSIN